LLPLPAEGAGRIRPGSWSSRLHYSSCGCSMHPFRNLALRPHLLREVVRLAIQEHPSKKSSIGISVASSSSSGVRHKLYLSSCPDCTNDSLLKLIPLPTPLLGAHLVGVDAKQTHSVVVPTVGKTHDQGVPIQD